MLNYNSFYHFPAIILERYNISNKYLHFYHKYIQLGGELGIIWPYEFFVNYINNKIRLYIFGRRFILHTHVDLFCKRWSNFFAIDQYEYEVLMVAKGAKLTPQHNKVLKKHLQSVDWPLILKWRAFAHAHPSRDRWNLKYEQENILIIIKHNMYRVFFSLYGRKVE